MRRRPAHHPPGPIGRRRSPCCPRRGSSRDVQHRARRTSLEDLTRRGRALPAASTMPDFSRETEFVSLKGDERLSVDRRAPRLDRRRGEGRGRLPADDERVRGRRVNTSKWCKLSRDVLRGRRAGPASTTTSSFLHPRAREVADELRAQAGEPQSVHEQHRPARGVRARGRWSRSDLIDEMLDTDWQEPRQPRSSRRPASASAPSKCRAASSTTTTSTTRTAGSQARLHHPHDPEPRQHPARPDRAGGAVSPQQGRQDRDIELLAQMLVRVLRPLHLLLGALTPLLVNDHANKKGPAHHGAGPFPFRPCPGWSQSPSNSVSA